MSNIDQLTIGDVKQLASMFQAPAIPEGKSIGSKMYGQDGNRADGYGQYSIEPATQEWIDQKDARLLRVRINVLCETANLDVLREVEEKVRLLLGM